MGGGEVPEVVYLEEILSGVIVKGSQERIVDCGSDLHEGGVVVVEE